MAPVPAEEDIIIPVDDHKFDGSGADVYAQSNIIQ
jgi:hypothetical protein